jgi:hypothetical protein
MKDESIESFLVAIREDCGEEVEERCRQIFEADPSTHERRAEVLIQARVEVYRERDDVTVPLEDLPCNT